MKAIKTTILKILSAASLWCATPLIYAQSIVNTKIDTSVVSNQSHGAKGGLGTMSSNMLAPVQGLRHVFNIAAILLGIYMLLMAFVRFTRFRQNPQESPLSVVIFWAFLGLLLIALPIAYTLTTSADFSTGMKDLVF